MDKLDPCAENCVFVGYGYYYSPQHSGQGEEQCDPLSWLSYTSADTIGNEIQNHSTTSAEALNISATPEHPVPDMIYEVSSSQPNNLDNPQPDNLDENNADDIQDSTSEILQEHEEEVPRNLCSEEIPSSFEQALKSEKWKKAMDDEMKALKKNKTWDQCALPQGKKPVGCRWIFIVKYKPDGAVERYKARLVAKGHTQTYGIGYSETFSLVAKVDTIRVLLSVASNQRWPLHQFDVKNAFLHEELKKEVYMKALPGFSEHFKPGEACRLKKSLYRLKQSPRAWFGRFMLAMKRYGFKQSNSLCSLKTRKIM
nr:putative ribonuclease H-like domain-containing protein [Tanacetum cinerariifolium]